MWAQGRTREAMVHGANVRLTRRIWARLGESRLFIDDVVENLGYARVPHMIAYHINLGFPLLDDGAELLSSAQEIEPITDDPDAAARTTASAGPCASSSLASSRPMPSRSACLIRRRRSQICAPEHQPDSQLRSLPTLVCGRVPVGIPVGHRSRAPSAA